jgi:hypothetical protein
MFKMCDELEEEFSKEYLINYKKSSSNILLKFLENDIVPLIIRKKINYDVLYIQEKHIYLKLIKNVDYIQIINNKIFIPEHLIEYKNIWKKISECSNFLVISCIDLPILFKYLKQNRIYFDKILVTDYKKDMKNYVSLLGK